MAYTQSDLDALDAAIRTGVKEIRFQDRTQTFQTTADLLATRNFVYSQLHPAGSTPAPNRQIRLYTSKGLGS